MQAMPHPGGKNNGGRCRCGSVDEDSVMQTAVPRESHTSNLKEFDRFVERLRSDASRQDYRPHCPIELKLWNYFRSLLQGFEKPVGFAPRRSRPVAPSEDGFYVPRGTQQVAAFERRLMQARELWPINPKRVAEACDLSLDVVLTELFYATRIGLTSISWAPECQRCGGEACVQDRLSAIPANEAIMCHSCRQATHLRSLDKVKVVFRFCSDVFFVLADKFPCQISKESLNNTVLLAPVPATQGPPYGVRYSVGCAPTNTSSQSQKALPAGKYRIHCPVSCVDIALVVKSDVVHRPKTKPDVLKLRVSDLSMDWATGKFELQTFTVSDGRIHFDIYNDTKSYFVLWVKKDTNDDALYCLPRDERLPYVSATEVLHHPLFEHFFSNQAVPRGAILDIEHVVIVFTDVVESTAMYAAFGDGEALRVIMKHFEVVFAAFSKRGRVVKTIGDSVMASFASGRAAIEAAAEALQEVPAKCAKPNGLPLQIRIGIHSGPAVVIPVNGVNDYFGQTVNVAARVEALAGSSEVLVTDTVLTTDPDASAAFKSLVSVEDDKEVSFWIGTGPRNLSLKGVAGEVRVHGCRSLTSSLHHVSHVVAVSTSLEQRKRKRPRTVSLLNRET